MASTSSETEPSTGPGQRDGLSDRQAAETLARVGPNSLPTVRRRPWPLRLMDELVHFFALMLWAAVLLAWIADMPVLSVAISLVVVLNAVFAFVQEERAGKAADRLKVLLPHRVTVRRSGRSMGIEAVDVVPGDVLLLEAGDRVPADGVVLVAASLMVDSSMLTGESGSVATEEGADAFAGTFVVEGSAEVLVRATGEHTRLARIAALTTSTLKPRTPLTIELGRLVKIIAVMALGVGSAFFVLTWLLGRPAREAVVFGIGVTVALVPEALLPTVTLSLAWGAEQMASRHVLVRNLEAVETLGSVTFVCTDKTGTLTRNEMSVVEACTPEGAVTITGTGYEPVAEVTATSEKARAGVEAVARLGVLASTGVAVRKDDGTWAANGEPMDAAIDVFARRLGLDTDELRAAQHDLVRFPFDSQRRCTSVVTDHQVVVKGAPDALLLLCRDHSHDADVEAELDRLARRSLRVLAIAQKTWTGDDASTAARDDVESDLELVGLIALEDPPREGISDALAACRRAGVGVAMLTGDHPLTARAIAERIGLWRPDSVVLIGGELPADDDVLGALLDRDGAVVARVEPEDKLRIARALRRRGHVVAMTGDGVNDAPALHEADIGVAMGISGTDVAREAADLVLLDDHFTSIVAGIELGRATFVNVRRFLTYHLTDNVAEVTPFIVWALSGGHFPLALGVLQILAIDLGTDTMSAVALGAEPPGAHVLEGPPVSGHLLNGTVARRAFGLLGPAGAFMSMLAFVVSFVALGWRPGDEFPRGDALAVASGAAFLAVVLSQKANVWACRSSSRTPWEIGWSTNRLLIPAALIELAFCVVVLTVPPIADRLGQAVPNAAGATVAVLAIPVMFAVDALDKRAHRHRRFQAQD